MEGPEEVQAKHLDTRLWELKVGLEKVVQPIAWAVFEHKPHCSVPREAEEKALRARQRAAAGVLLAHIPSGEEYNAGGAA